MFNIKKFFSKDAKTQIQKFVIIGMPRTGTTMVVEMLDSQESVLCNYEIFNDNNSGLNKKLDLTIEDKESLLKIRKENPIFFLEKVFEITPKKYSHVGFKILDFQSQDIFKYIFNNPEFKIIIVGRKNILKTYISYRIALSNSKWTGDRNNIKIKVDFEDFLKFEKQHINTYENWFNILANKNKYLYVEYEDLIGNRRNFFYKNIANFLSIKNFVDNYKKLYVKKQNSDLLSDVVENYSELIEQLEKRGLKKYIY